MARIEGANDEFGAVEILRRARGGSLCRSDAEGKQGASRLATWRRAWVCAAAVQELFIVAEGVMPRQTTVSA